LFRHWFTLAERCPSCGWQFQRKGDEGFGLGAMAVNFVISEGLFAAFLIIGFIVTSPDPPVVWLTGLGLALNATMVLFFYPFSQTVWAAFELKLRPLTPEEERAAAEAVIASRR
jgi:hypothetical protein